MLTNSQKGKQHLGPCIIVGGVLPQVRKRFKINGIKGIIDPLLEYEYSREAYTAMAELGLLCTTFNKDERPSMKVNKRVNLQLLKMLLIFVSC